MPSYRPKPPFPTLNRNHRLARGLVAAWVMGEGAGNSIYDIADNKNTLTRFGAPPWSPSSLGHSLSFNGSNQYLGASRSLWTPGTSNQSWLVWCIPGNSSKGFIFGQDVSGSRAVLFETNFNTSNVTEVGKWSGGFTSSDGSAFLYGGNTTASFAVGDLCFFAMVRTGLNTIAGYQDGKRQTLTMTQTMSPSVMSLNAVTIGRRAFTGSEDYFNGRILQVLHYNRALSESEIAQFNFDPFAPFRYVPRRWHAGFAGAFGRASITLRPATVSATGTVALTGTAAVQLRAATVNAAGALALKGSTGITLRAASLAATGHLQPRAFAAASITLQPATVTAVGALQPLALGSATITLQRATLSATGYLQPIAFGTATITLQRATLSATGALALRGTATVHLRPATVVGTGQLAASGSAEIALRPATVVATGNVIVRGEAAITLRAATLTATGLVLRGLIGEQEHLDGARSAPIALMARRRAPVMLGGSSDMRQV